MMSLEALLNALDAPFSESWSRQLSEALTQVVTARGSRLEVTEDTKPGKNRLQLRRSAPNADVPFVALIAPGQDPTGKYGGLSFVVFGSEEGPSLIGWVVGTQSIEPDQDILSRPGHARKAQAIARTLNRAAGQRVSWAKNDPTLIEDSVRIPRDVVQQFERHSAVFARYGHVIHLMYAPPRAYSNDPRAREALLMLLDNFISERSLALKTEHERERMKLRARWMEQLLPGTSPERVGILLRDRRFVILEGPPGTGKTRLARTLLADRFAGHGKTIQFHANSTYESFVGGLAPEPASEGLSFRPRAGQLMTAVAEAARSGADYLLHIDEINRADLAKVLGECIYLFEPNTRDRELELPWAFAEIAGRRLRLPPNLYILGTMNSSDRSIAPIDLALRRRFAFEPLWPQPQVVEAQGDRVLKDLFDDLLEVFVDMSSEEAFALAPGHSYFLHAEGAPRNAKRLLQASLRPLLTEYLRQGLCHGFADELRGFVERIDSLPEEE